MSIVKGFINRLINIIIGFFLLVIYLLEGVVITPFMVVAYLFVNKRFDTVFFFSGKIADFADEFKGFDV